MNTKLNCRTDNIALALVLLAAVMVSGAPMAMASDYGVSTSNGTQVNSPPPAPPRPKHRPPAVTSVRG
jgi:hypothetical protein